MDKINNLQSTFKLTIKNTHVRIKRQFMTILTLQRHLLPAESCALLPPVAPSIPRQTEHIQSCSSGDGENKHNVRDKTQPARISWSLNTRLLTIPIPLSPVQ